MSAAPPAEGARGRVPPVIDTLAADVLALCREPETSTRHRFLLGIAGPPAAGKSTLAERLVHRINGMMRPDYAAVVPVDGYHLRNSALDELGLRPRKGAPNTFDVSGYGAKLHELRTHSGRDVLCPSFDRQGNEEPTELGLVVPGATRVIVTEGNYLLLQDPPWSVVRPLLDLVWYVDAEVETVRDRSLARHRQTGNDEATARWRVENNDLKNYWIVDSARHRADRIIGRWS